MTSSREKAQGVECRRFFTPFTANVRTASDSDVASHTRALESLGLPVDDGRIVPVLISTNKTARDGHRIFDWDVAHYTQRNPVVLWGHDRDAPAIGRAPVVTWDKGSGELRALAQFAPREINEFGYRIGEMVAAGYVNQPSVGWETLDYEEETDPVILREYPWALRINMAQLLEFSVVNVEADTATGFGRSLEQARADGMELSEIKRYASRKLDMGYHSALLENMARSTKTISTPLQDPEMNETQVRELVAAILAERDAPTEPKTRNIDEETLATLGSIPDALESMSDAISNIHGMLSSMQESDDNPVDESDEGPVDEPVEAREVSVEESKRQFAKLFS